LDQGYVGSPWYGTFSNTFRSTLGNHVPGIEIYAEHLDFGHFSGARHEEISRVYLRDKYGASRIRMIVAAGPKALEFAVKFRRELGSEIPIVFSVVDTETLTRLSPSNTTGRVLQYTLHQQMDAAKALVPKLKHIAVVGDPLENQSFMQQFRREIPAVAAQMDVIDLTGLSIANVKIRAAALPDDSAIIYTAINVDGAGVAYIPRDALVAIAAVANRPIVVDSETMIGYGGAGGFVASPTVLAKETALLTSRVLRGEITNAIPISDSDLKPIFDWRQLKRWQVSEDGLPPDSELRFRESTAWEQYQSQIIAIGLALLLQAGMIVGLVVEHWRRRRAEAAALEGLTESLKLKELHALQERTAHTEKLASLGRLTAGIAHELNTPVGTSLTIASILTERCKGFESEQSAGQLRRSQLAAFVQGNFDAALQLTTNLRRTSELIDVFKKAAVSHTVTDRHSFDLKRATDQFLASLRPILGRRFHQS